MIKHVLKDGTVLKGITGHVVKAEECPAAYEVLERVRRKEAEGVSVPA